MSAGIGAVVVAAGSGLRFGGETRKQYQPLGGVPMLQRALRPFVDHPALNAVVVVVPADDLPDPPDWLVDSGVRLVAGGSERSDSVQAGLRALPEGTGTVLVHDGARPLVDRALIDRVLAACAPGTGVVPALPVTDTVKEVDGTGRVVRTPPRERLCRAQTPQAFPLDDLRSAYARVSGGTDDAQVFASAGGEVRVVPGSEVNLKVTRPLDLRIAEILLATRARPGEPGPAMEDA